MTTVVRKNLLGIASDTALTNLKGAMSGTELRALHAEYRAAYLAQGLTQAVEIMDRYESSPLVDQETFLPDVSHGKHHYVDMGMYETSRGLDKIWGFSFSGSVGTIVEIHKAANEMTVDTFIDWVKKSMKETAVALEKLGKTEEEIFSGALVFVTLHGESGCYTILPGSKSGVYEHFDDSGKTFVSGTGRRLFISEQDEAKAFLTKDWEKLFSFETHLDEFEIIRAASMIDEFTNSDVQSFYAPQDAIDTYVHRLAA